MKRALEKETASSQFEEYESDIQFPWALAENKKVNFGLFQEGDLFTKEEDLKDNEDKEDKQDLFLNNCSKKTNYTQQRNEINKDEEFPHFKMIDFDNLGKEDNEEYDDILQNILVYPNKDETIDEDDNDISNNHSNNKAIHNLYNKIIENKNNPPEKISQQEENIIDILSSIEQEQFDNNENRMLLNNFLSFTQDQNYCRYLQQKINSEPQLTSYFFPTIISHINELIIHPYGNYLIQSIFIHITETQMNELLIAIKDNFTLICTNFYGTRVIQKLVMCIYSRSPMMNLLNILRENFTNIINDINSRHIIFNMLSLNIYEIKSSIYNMLTSHILEIATHKQGCCSIQKILENDMIYTNNIINCLINHSAELIAHQYGNYTIQYILQLNNPIYTPLIIQKLLPCFGELAKGKYSSPVLEKCFELCDGNSKKDLFKVISVPYMIKMLICDKYGNYVIQKAIDTASEKKKGSLLRIIASITKDIKKEDFGKQLYMKLCANYPKLQKMNKGNKKKSN